MSIDAELFLKHLGIRAEIFESLDSTSLYLKRQIEANEAVPDLVLARSQTNGQGRVGKRFFSPMDTGIYATFVFPLSRFSLETLTPAVAVAVLNAIDSVFFLSCGLKWVNDIYLKDKKVAGILCQKVNHYVLIGIGINLEKPKEVPDDLEGKFGVLTEKCSDDTRFHLICRIYQNLEALSTMHEESILRQYRNRCVHLGRNVSLLYDQKIVSGICVGIGDDFSLQIKTKESVQSYQSGVLTLHEKNHG